MRALDEAGLWRGRNDWESNRFAGFTKKTDMGFPHVRFLFSQTRPDLSHVTYGRYKGVEFHIFLAVDDKRLTSREEEEVC